MVTRELTINQVIQASQSLKALSNLEGAPLSLAWAARSAEKALAEHLERYGEEQKKLLDKYGIPKKDAESRGEYDFETKEKKEKYLKEWNKLLNTEVTCSFNQIDSKNFDGSDIKVKFLGDLIDPLVENFIK